jgi:hypothetical protein
MRMANTQTGDSHEKAGINQEHPGTSAREQIREVKEQVVDQAKSSLRQAKERATSSLGESRDRFAEQIGAVAEAFRRTGEHLRSENQQRVAGLTDSAARQADQVANYVRNFDPRTSRDDLESLARRQPALVLGGAFALGLMGARFFKSSRRKDGGAQTRSGGYPDPERHGEYAGYRGSPGSGTLAQPGAETTMNAGETDARS